MMFTHKEFMFQTVQMLAFTNAQIIVLNILTCVMATTAVVIGQMK